MGISIVTPDTDATRYDFAGQDSVLGLDKAGHVFQFRIAPGKIVLIPRDERDFAIFDERHRAIPIPFNLE